MYKIQNYFNILLLCIAALTGMASCDKASLFDDVEGTGYLSTKRLMLNVSDEEKRKAGPATRAVELADFVIDIIRDGKVECSYRYADMPGVIELPVGSYTAVAHLGDNKDAAWTEPYYRGETSFEIKKDEIEDAQTIECKLANVRVTVVYSDELLQAMSDDSKVSVLMGRDANLDYVKTETRSGYFAYVEGSNTLVATFRGIIDGVEQSEQRIHTDVAPGTHYRLTYTLHKPGPGTEGGINPGLTVDVTIEEVDLNFNIDPGDDDRPDDDDRPGGGSGQNPPPPVTGGPTITIEPPLSFDQVNQVTPSSQVKINVSSSTGVTAFDVYIISDALTPDELAGANLTDHLDLVNPGEFEDAINGLGLPVNVGGMKEILFDISSFMPLLAAFSPSQHKFKLVVSDASGTTTKILQLSI